jgi:hypothetical protein
MKRTFVTSNGGRGIRTPMSLAARWISSPLPYQLGLALHGIKSSISDTHLLHAHGGVVKIAGTFVQLLNCCLFVVARQMGIAQCHSNLFVSQQFLHRRELNSRHYQPTRKGMAQVMKCKALNACLTYRPLNCRPKKAIRSAMPIAEYSFPFGSVHFTRLQHHGQGAIHRHTAGFPMLGIACPYCNYPRRKSTSAQVSKSSSEPRKPVMAAVAASVSNWGP